MAATVANPAFWKGKRVLLTGHTGFKGSWAALWLKRLGANVTGFALPAEGPESHSAMLGLDALMDSRVGDVRDARQVRDVVRERNPDVILHMAAQALVRRSYTDPVTTWETNLNGTLNVLEALRANRSRAIALIITSDKVYKNDESGRAFVEGDALGGHDPYSASKAACEILAASWRQSYAEASGCTLATARAGNVIGGGDFSSDRIVPDIWRAARKGEDLILRNPGATRPWQHVLDCLNGYFLYVEALASRSVPLAMNFGPDAAVSKPVGEIAAALLPAISATAKSVVTADDGPREMGKLALDTTLARTVLGWRDVLVGEALFAWTADWYKACAGGRDMRLVTGDQIAAFEALAQRKP